MNFMIRTLHDHLMKSDEELRVRKFCFGGKTCGRVANVEMKCYF